jgi:molybdopterin-guanine dinucleotide biosynthesis protein A
MLAGGKARRMGGGDKCLLPLTGQTLLQRSLTRALPQVDTLLLSANGSSLRFARTRLPVLADSIPGQPGPLAGIYQALLWMRENAPHSEWLVSFASDAPFLPEDQLQKLQAAVTTDEQLVIARANDRIQPAFALWHISLLPEIEQVLTSGMPVDLRQWASKQRAAFVDFHNPHYDPFFNINTPQDLYAAEVMLQKQLASK